MARSRVFLGPLVVALLANAACVTTSTIGVGGPRKGAASRSPAGSVVPQGSGSAATRVVVPQGLAVATLVGKAKLLSDMGGAIISDMGGAIISNNSGALIANNGGGLVGKAKYGLRQAAGPAEVLLADALVTVFDAAGRQLVGEDGKPLQAVTDATGSYTLRAALPTENLLLRIKLFNGGELVAIAAKQAAETRTVVLDTASTLGATYVLDRFVKGSQQTFDKLPASEAENLRNRLAAAQPLIKEPPSYKPADSLALTEALRQQDSRVAETLDTIKALLLGGLGDGRAATRVALNKPAALALMPDGELLIGETDFGRIRRLKPDGTQSLWLDGRAGEIRDNLIGLQAMARLADGSVLALASNRRRVYRLVAGAAPEVVLGTGKRGGDFAPMPATQVAMEPGTMAVAPDGTIWVGQEHPAMLVRFRLGGTAEQVPLPPGVEGGVYVHHLAVGGPNDALHLLTDERGSGALYRRNADGSWALVSQGRAVDHGGFTVTADGTIYLCEDLNGALTVLSPDGTAAGLPGPTEPALALRWPAGIVRAADGTLFISDVASNLVLARNPAGAWRLVAGNSDTVQAGADQITFNAPTALAFDAQGRLVVTEAGGHALKRWDGKVLETISGGVRGFAGDGGPAASARFDSPGALAYRGAELIVSDVLNFRIRSIGADGTIRTLVGADRPPSQAPVPAGAALAPEDLVLRRAVGLAVGPDGSIYWASMADDQILRLAPDGRVRLVAGRGGHGETPPDEPDGPALTSAVAGPGALAFKPGEPDNLYFTELASCRVRRIVGVTGPAPRLETVAGLGRLPTLLALAGLAPGWETADNGVRGTDAMVVVPMGLTFGPDGSLYVAEGGTTNVNQLLANVGDVLGDVDMPQLAARIRRVAPDGTITTVIGPGGRVHPDPGAEDAIGLPLALAFDGAGRLAIIDARSNSVRLVPAEAFR